VVEDGGRVRVNGAEIHYEVGREGQPLVLLHDSLLDRRVWDDQFAAVLRRFEPPVCESISRHLGE
jgi:pimeloyl-ACP methyl ester carboxylesterase